MPAADAPSWRSRGVALVGLAVVVAVLVERLRWYFPFLSDDALISLRYAQRFLEGEGLTWTDGERVEGYTDFAWVLLTALLGLFRVDLVVAARALGILGAGLAVGFTSLRPERVPSLSVVRIASGALLLALSDPLAAWAVGALEHGLQAGVIVTAAWLLIRNEPSRVLPAVLVLLVWLRADGAVIVTALLFGNGVRGLLEKQGLVPTLRKNVALGLVPLGALLAQLLFRRAYYGEWVPNTALVKVSFSWARVELGLSHLREWTNHGGWPLLVLSALAVGLALRARRFTVLIPLCASLGWWAYLASVGGDIFPAWRQVLLGLVPLGLVVSEGADAWWEAARPAEGGLGFPRLLSVVVLAALVVEYRSAQRSDPQNERAVKERWEFEGVSLGPVLRTAWGARKPLMAVDAAGTLPYYSRLPSLDMLGLNDRYIAKHPPDLTGKLSTGHELGDGAYAWTRKPDILAFCAGMGGRTPCFLGGRQFVAMPEFNRTYQVMRYFTPGPPELRGELWIRREDSVLGVQRTADQLIIPGWLLAQESGVAELHGNTFMTRVSVYEPGRLRDLEVPAGRWRVRAGEGFTVGVLCAGRSVSRAGAGLVLETDGTRRVDLLVGTTGAPAWVEQVVLERTTDAATSRCDDTPTLEFDVASLATRVPAGANYLQPTGVVLSGKASVRVRLPAGHGGTFEVGVDANDSFQVRVLKGDQLLSESTLPGQPLGGIALRPLDVPLEAELVELLVTDGDGLSGLAHFVAR